MSRSLLEAKSLDNEFYRPLITKKSIAIRDNLILENYKANQNK